METQEVFERCIYCFSPKQTSGPCKICGYDNGLCNPPGWWLSPSSILKGRYIVGRNLNATATELAYLCWDLKQNSTAELVEYFPTNLVKRDITHSDTVSCIPGCEQALEEGKQKFFEKAKLFYNCVSRVEENLVMDFFVRNNTCYYVRKRYPSGQENEK